MGDSDRYIFTDEKLANELRRFGINILLPLTPEKREILKLKLNHYKTRERIDNYNARKNFTTAMMAGAPMIGTPNASASMIGTPMTSSSMIGTPNASASMIGRPMMAGEPIPINGTPMNNSKFRNPNYSQYGHIKQGGESGESMDVDDSGSQSSRWYPNPWAWFR